MQFEKKIIKFLILLGVFLLIFLGLTLPAIFQKTHFLQNLEPYPDGILYALSARNFVQGEGMQLVYGDSALHFWVPRMYSIALIPGYLISSNPTVFYLSNVFFGLLSLILLLYIVRITTEPAVAPVIAGLVYLSHVYVLWLASVPMAENLVLPLFLAAVLGLVRMRDDWRYSLLAFSAAGLLFLTKLSLAVVIGMILLLLLIGLYQGLSQKRKIIAWIISGAVASIFIFQYGATLLSLLSGDSPFYGFRFLLGNLNSYGQMLLGSGGNFLWLQNALSSIGMLGIFVFAVWQFLRSKSLEWRWRGWLLLGLFIAQFPIMLIFYVADARYIILTVPIFALAAGWLTQLQLEFLKSRKQRNIFFLSVGLTLVVQLWVQLPLVRQVVAANLLGRTVGWQLEEIRHFDQVLKNDSEVFLITALPPFLVEAYSVGSYRVLPMSNSQEFLQKSQWVWGCDIDPEESNICTEEKISSQVYSSESLTRLYDQLFAEGKKLYISNAYISHSHEVVLDYEELEKTYSFELVSEGCLGTCNVYVMLAK
ncbi:MAG: hypothetical protein COY80_01120 [Candidatus Pacebacteria bacterium CG_4_10_14_0_8_um_filter_42_14]|nr:MAG: hypothetical protein COY80_01120 [Candidatus Pacebacteria bacterium CG_4_10_14_0_8_um_filter_42_14]